MPLSHVQKQQFIYFLIITLFTFFAILTFIALNQKENSKAQTPVVVDNGGAVKPETKDTNTVVLTKQEYLSLLELSNMKTTTIILEGDSFNLLFRIVFDSKARENIISINARNNAKKMPSDIDSFKSVSYISLDTSYQFKPYYTENRTDSFLTHWNNPRPTSLYSLMIIYKNGKSVSAILDPKKGIITKSGVLK